MKPQTVQEIADKLNLSSVTVSSVLNNKAKERGFADSTIKRVQDYIKESGFHQSISALAMKGKYSKALGIVSIDSYRFPAHNLLINAVQSYTSCKKISSVMFSANGYNPAGLSEIIQQIKIYNVKKILVLATGLYNFPGPLKSFIENIRLNLPNAKCYIHDCKIPIAYNNFMFSEYRNLSKQYKLINKIATENKYKKLITLGSPVPLDGCSPEIEVECAGESMNLINYNPEYMLRDQFYADHGAYLAKLMKDYNFKGKKTLVYIQDDFASMGFAQQMRKYGYKIPQDFGLVSWDNLPVSELMDITSFGYDYNKIAKNVVGWINDDNPAVGQKEIKIVQNKAKSF